MNRNIYLKYLGINVVLKGRPVIAKGEIRQN